MEARNRPVTLTLVALTLVSLATTAYLVATHKQSLGVQHFLPAAGMVVVLGAWLYMTRSRGSDDPLSHCVECGTMWRPDEGRECPACLDA